MGPVTKLQKPQINKLIVNKSLNLSETFSSGLEKSTLTYTLQFPQLRRVYCILLVLTTLNFLVNGTLHLIRVSSKDRAFL